MAYHSRESFDFGWKFKLADDELCKPYEHWLLTGAFNEGAPAFQYDDTKWEVVDLPHDFVVSGNFTNKNLMERGTPAEVRKEVHRQIRETGVLQHGGIFIDSSSETNPPVRPENFKAMIDAVGELRNPEFR